MRIPVRVCVVVSVPSAVVFDLYDADNSGSITRDELARVLFTIADQDLQVALQTAGKIVDVFDAMDTNKDERVSFDGACVSVPRGHCRWGLWSPRRTLALVWT